MKDLKIAWHLGLGDGIICNGLIRELAKKYDSIHLPCYKKNFNSVNFMFSDLPNVFVQIVEDENDMKASILDLEKKGVEVLKLGCYRNEPHLEPESFDQTFYRQAGVDFECRWSSFKLPENYPASFRVPESKSISFICDDESRNFKIDDSIIITDCRKIRPEKSGMIFDWLPYLLEAREIHTIDTSWLHLIESIPTKGKLFYHLYARNAGPYHQAKKRKNWIILS